MLKIKITTNFPYWPLERQTPDWSAKWGDCEFYINKPTPKCDYWVVVGGLSKKEYTMCPNGNTIFITGEPPVIKEYNKDFIRQFDKIITCHKKINHSNIINYQQGLPWFVGRREKSKNDVRFELGYDEIKEKSINKTDNNKISVIISNKITTKDQKQRIKFIKYLKKKIGNQLDIYGKAFNYIEDKWDVLLDYKYTIVMENCRIDDYWSEKLADAYIAECYPFYYGCKNLRRYFNYNSFEEIDIYKKEKSLNKIIHAIESNIYEKKRKWIKKSKILVLDKYNIFQLINDFIESNKSNQYYNKVIIPESFFFKKNILTKIKSKIISISRK